ncbi:MAG: prolipoprotein diacylglyceryl transferase family protein [Bradymonadaceae bacterium]
MQTPIAALPFWKFGPWTPIPGLDWLKFHSFGMFVAIGLIVCLAAATRRGERKLGMDGIEVQDFGIILIVVGWIFAHIFNVLFYTPGKILENPLVLLNPFGSISSYGGLLGGIIGLWIWHFRNPDKDVLLWTDHAVWTLTFAWFFGRVGCTSVHDHLGVQAPAWFPLAFDVPARWGGAIRFDLGFLEAIWWLVIVATVVLLDRRPRKRGFFMAIVPLMYAPVRFVLDFLRLWPLPDGDGYDVPAHAQYVLDLFDTHPESLVSYQGKLYRVTPDALAAGEIPEKVLLYGEAWFADTRYLGFTPAQFLSMVLFGFGIYMTVRIQDEETVEWEEFDPEDRDAPE